MSNTKAVGGLKKWLAPAVQRASRSTNGPNGGREGMSPLTTRYELEDTLAATVTVVRLEEK
jgi:hypothetical protein